MMKKTGLFLLITLILNLNFGGFSAADEILLKNGRDLRGVIVQEDSGSVTIQLKIGSVTVAKNQIETIRRESEEENEEILRHWEAQKRTRQIEEAPPEEETAAAAEEDKTPLVQPKSRIYTKDKRIYVDNELFFVKGVAYGINYPGTVGGMGGYYRIPFEIFEKDFSMMAEAGVNCIRTYEPLPPELLDLAEKYNIKVIENIVYPGDWTNYNSKEELQQLKEEALKIVQRDKNRPCILMWSIWNDAPFTWGEHGGNVIKRYGMETVSSFLEEIYDAVKEEDPEHLITASNMLGHIGSEVGWNFIDVIGVNAYIGGHGQWLGITKAEESISQLEAIADEYQKPVIILEAGYSTYINEDLQYEVIKSQIEITDQHIAGIAIFQWTDGWWKAGEPSVHDDHIEEHWGLLTGYRGPKPGYKALFETYNAIDTNSLGYKP